jgi:hypothetical protein
MKRIFLFLFIICSSLVMYAQHEGHNHAQDNPAATAGNPIKPEPLVFKETEYDFGKIPQGKPVTHIFEVSNVGQAAMKISNVQASCGCTTPEWEKDKEIPSGSSTRITVGYNAAAEGPFTKFITVSYGDSQTKQIVIKGEVWKTPASSAPENKSLEELKN